MKRLLALLLSISLVFGTLTFCALSAELGRENEIEIPEV